MSKDLEKEAKEEPEEIAPEEQKVCDELQQAFNDRESDKSDEDFALDTGDNQYMTKRRRKKLKELSAAEVTSVAHAEIVGITDRKSNAFRHNITVALVGRIVRAAKKDKSFLQHRLDKADEKKALVEAIKDLYGSWNEQAFGMLTAARMKEQLKALRGIDAS